MWRVPLFSISFSAKVVIMEEIGITLTVKPQFWSFSLYTKRYPCIIYALVQCCLLKYRVSILIYAAQDSFCL